MGERIVRPRRIEPGAVREVFAKSVMGEVDKASSDAIFATGQPRRLQRKEYFFRANDQYRCGLIVDGLVRFGRSDPEGHEATLLWVRTPEFVGLSFVVRTPTPVFVQAVTDATIVEYPVALIRELAHRDASVSWALATYSTDRLRKAIDTLFLYSSGDLRARVQMRLLEAACRTPPDSPLIAPITQEDLAHACGATRSSVARILHDLREEGSIRSMYGGILVVRPEALAPRETKVA